MSKYYIDAGDLCVYVDIEWNGRQPRHLPRIFEDAHANPGGKTFHLAVALQLLDLAAPPPSPDSSACRHLHPCVSAKPTLTLFD